MNKPALTHEQQKDIGRVLLATGFITEKQFQQGRIFAVTSEAMAPELPLGSFVHAVPIGKDNCDTAVGRMVVLMVERWPGQHLIGRLVNTAFGRVEIDQHAGKLWSQVFALSLIKRLFLVTATYTPESGHETH